MNRLEILSGLTLLPLAGAAALSSPSNATKVPEAEEWLPKKQLIGASRNGSLISKCLRSGHLIFVAGIGGWYEADRAIPGDAKVQVRSALASMKESLEEGGSNMSNVLQIFMTIAEPEKNLGLINEAFHEFFPENPPVRSFSSSKVTQMGRDGILVQVGCIAYVD
ncbi:MAG: RidA family protein [Daejeonella sp.]|uniref:RidA family protein n=1 Tax=Daejeonella sp. JGW-45 TaxID=3034148 RepID=UPI0023ECE6E0|nr:Rid family hydrolase [Daejeonella sp. JGW-45]